jgi:hypothetical protein
MVRQQMPRALPDASLTGPRRQLLGDAADAHGSGHCSPRAWRILHLAGGYYLWFQFMVSFGKRVPGMSLYAAFLIPLLVVMAPRLIAMASARTPSTAEAG